MSVSAGGGSVDAGLLLVEVLERAIAAVTSSRDAPGFGRGDCAYIRCILKVTSWSFPRTQMASGIPHRKALASSNCCVRPRGRREISGRNECACRGGSTLRGVRRRGNAHGSLRAVQQLRDGAFAILPCAEEAKALFRKTIPVDDRALADSNDAHAQDVRWVRAALYHRPCRALDDLREASSDALEDT